MNRIKIGWGRREYSLDEPVNIPGQMYMRRSEGIMDPLYITALCIDGGNDCDAVIFCSVDAIGIYGWLSRALDDLYAARPDIPRDSVIVNATHTHASMSFNNKEDAFPDGSYLYNGDKVYRHFIKKFIEAVSEAWDSRADGGMGYGYGYAVVGHSRRSVYGVDMSVKKPNAVAPNGHGVMYGKTNDPDFLGYEAGSDHFLNVMFTFDCENELTGIVINVPCPSQTSEHFTMLSADYWNEVREGIAKEFGKEVYVLPQCAAAGDLSPRILHYLDAQERRYEMKYGLAYDPHKGSMKNINKSMGDRYDIAGRIIDGVTEVYSWAKKDIQTDVPVRHRCIEVPLKRREITDEDVEWCKTNIENMKNQIPDKNSCTPEEYRVAMSQYNSIKTRNNRAIKRAEEIKAKPNLAKTLHAVQVGEISFSSNPFELYMDYMHRIQARSPFVQTFIVQLAGDEDDYYLPTERGILNRGYSASIFCNSVGPEGGQQLVEATLGMLNDMKSNDETQA